MQEKFCPGCMQPNDQPVCPHCGWPEDASNAPHQLRCGTMLRGQYLVGKVLGQGGFGITYLGYDTYLDMPVAIKEFYPGNLVGRDHNQSSTVTVHTGTPDNHYYGSLDRFIREAKALAKLRNVSHIVGVQSFFQENNTAYIIMEYVRGTELREYVRNRGGRLSVTETLRILEPIVLALTRVHSEGLVHRDISPDNIMLHPTEGAMLLDFGAVRNVENPDPEKELTRSTEAIVKHGFAPMEQYRNRGGIGPWTDLYALCATIYYCLTGQVPADALTRSMGEGDIDWSAVPGLTPRQRAALEKGTALRSADRFSDLSQLYSELYTQEAAAPVPRKNPPQPASVPLQEEEPTPKAPKASTPPDNHKVSFGGVLFTLVIIALCCAFIYFSVMLFTLESDQPSMSAPDVPAAAAPRDDIPATAPAAETEPPQPWDSNLLKADPWAVMNIARTSITSVTFLDSTASAPDDAVEVGLNVQGSVLGWSDPAGNVTLAADGGINGKISCKKLFDGCTSLTTVNFGGAFHTEQATSMEAMFRSCVMLTTVDTENLDTSNVQDMYMMFCMIHGEDTYFVYPENKNLKKLDVSTWDTSSVVTMASLFQGCAGLEEVDVSRWDMSNVSDISCIFWTCESLKKLDVSHWDVSSVRYANEAFAFCSTLTELDVSRWDVGSLTYAGGMLRDCPGITRFDVGNWNTSSLVDASGLFMFCGSLKECDVSRWNTSNLESVVGMFTGCYQLPVPDVSGWNTGKLTEWENFYYANYNTQNTQLLFG